MNRSAFLQRLNARAVARYGVAPISNKMFGKWLEAKIIWAPDKHGRIRNWSPRQYRRALEIVRLKSMDIQILWEIRFQLWLKKCPGVDIEFGELEREVLIRHFC